MTPETEALLALYGRNLTRDADIAWYANAKQIARTRACQPTSRRKTLHQPIPAFAAAAAIALAGPIFWTGKIGYLLPTDPQIPVHITHCDGNVCVGKLGTLQGHNYRWLMGRDPVFHLNLTTG